MSILLLLTSVLPAWAAGDALSVLTFNAWMSEHGSQSPDRMERLKRLPDELGRLGADVIVLQELWQNSARRTLKRELAERGYPHAVDLNTVSETGLMIFSRLPVSPVTESIQFEQQSQVDRKAGRKKGALLIRLWSSAFGEFSVIATQLAEVGFDSSSATFSLTEHQIQRAQLGQLISWMENESARDEFSLLVGALEFHPFVWSRGEYTKVLSPDYMSLVSRGWIDLFDTPARSVSDTTWDPLNAYHRDSRAPARTLDSIWMKPNVRITSQGSKRVFSEEREKPLSKRAGIFSEFRIWQ